MNRHFFRKLAAGNIRKNASTYLPYIITCVVTTAIYYMVKSLSLNPGLEQMMGADTLAYTMYLGSWITAIFAFIFLFYTNSFLMKRRKKEFGVFNILGMEKRHLARTLAWETLYVTLLSLTLGLVLGIALDKIMFLVIARVVGGDISLGFFVSPRAIVGTVELFAVIFLLIWLHSVRQIHVANPIELLRDSRAGEREPKTRWLMAILGALCVGIGYYIAITTKNPITSIMAFFVAVLLVIAGTYMLFAAGSIALLKMLKKNKKFYYKTNHFTSVSGMIYRMKQNAVGLANICILSTMVLVMISATSSLMLGVEDIIHTRYPYQFTVYSDETDPASSQFIVVRDEEIPWLYECQKEALGDIANAPRLFYGFNVNVDDDRQEALFAKLEERLAQMEFQGTVESSAEARVSFVGLYGGFFFLGIFLGTLFVAATVLIIYYKQISEGYDDRERFVIMQKVGMSHQEVKASIHSQVLTVFFLPLLVAGCHVAAAFPLISKLLAIMNLLNTGLYVACTVGCFLIFAVMYVLIYLLTARTYYRIVSR